MSVLIPATYTVEIPSSKIKDFLSFYEPFKKENKNAYVLLFASTNEVAVTLYKSSKGDDYKAVFQGINAYKEALIWDNTLEEKHLLPPRVPRKEIRMPLTFPQIGSDEVGTGDFFGPIEVCAALVREEDLKRIEELGIDDSKKINDETILKLGPTLIKEFPYSHLSLDNLTYNEVYKNNNMNAIKAKMHNRCLLNLKKKFPISKVYQDQFAEEKLYYSYLREEKEVLRDITFHTKGESLYPSVALASMIARYSFLRKMEKLSDLYKMTFPLGAGENVDNFALTFKEKYGLGEFKKVAKINFSNYKKLNEN